jgi:protein-S-isoprenylcysteine O-methyltransferase Ste14
MPKASALEFRFRFFIHAILYLIGFTAPWNNWLHLDTVRTWQYLASLPSRAHWLSFSTATIAVLVLAILLMLSAASLRTWAAAYLGSSIVQAPAMHGNSVVAAGPYRHLRNPLYLGIFLHTLALAILMPPTGALFAVITIGLFQLRLITVEEAFLTAQLGEPYTAYCKQVPRLIPALKPRIPASSARPTWPIAFLGEIYMWGAFLSFAIAGWGYNAFLIIQGIIVSLGVSIIARVFIPNPKPAEQ